jgi:hypothetical protein
VLLRLILFYAEVFPYCVITDFQVRRYGLRLLSFSFFPPSVWHTRSQQEDSVFFKERRTPICTLYQKVAAKSVVLTKKCFLEVRVCDSIVVIKDACGSR